MIILFSGGGGEPDLTDRIGMVTGSVPVITGVATGVSLNTILSGNLPVLSENNGSIEAICNSCSITDDLPAIAGSIRCGAAIQNSDLPVITGALIASFPLVADITGQLPVVSGNLASGAEMGGDLPVLSGQLIGAVHRGAELAGQLPGIQGAISCLVDVPATMGDEYTLPVVGGYCYATVGTMGRITGVQAVIRGGMAGLAGRIGSLNGRLPVLQGRMISQLAQDGDITGTLPVLAGEMFVDIDSDRILEHRRAEVR